MERIIKNNPPKGPKPIDITTLTVSDDDCFGNEWDRVAQPCLKCSEYEICMIICTQKGTEAKRNQIRNRSGKFFDELDWNAVPWDKLKTLIEEDPGSITLSEVRELVFEKSNSIDQTTVNYKVRAWLIENGFKVDDGKIYLV